MIYPEEYTEPAFDPLHGIKSKEKNFFERFKTEIKEPCFVFYNLILKFPGVKHREIDFLVINNFGLFIVELKNSEYKISNGKWMYFRFHEDKWYNVEAKNQYTNPIEQMETVGTELIQFLKKNNKGVSPINLKKVFALLFLLKNNNTFRNSINIESIVNIKIHDEIKINLNKLFTEPKELVSDSLIKKIADIILKNANYYPTFERRMEEHKKKIIALTKEQLLLLEDLKNPNILLSGVAGSGKTLMALEAANIAKKKKWKTLLICRSSNLNRYLKSICSKENPYIEVQTMTSFCKNIVEEAKKQAVKMESLDYQIDEDYLRVKLPEQVNNYLSKMKINLFNFLIVDEAQDIMSFTELSILDKVLENGFDKGKWLVCYDEEQALYGELKEGLDYLKSFNPKFHQLSVNKRTPKSIYELSCMMSGKSKTKAELDDYTTPQFISYKTVDKGKELLFELIDHAVTERNISVEDIVILSPNKKTDTEVLGSMINLKNNKSRNQYKIKTVEDGVFATNCVGFSEIARFKGMERKFIILTGVNDFTDPNLANQIYVALTRTTHMFAVLYNDKAKESLKKRLGQTNIKRIKDSSKI